MHVGFMQPGSVSELHVHEDEVESMYLISGELEVTVGDLQFRMRSGESYFAPRNTLHRVRNAGTAESRSLFIGTSCRFTCFSQKPVFKREAETYLFFGVPTVIHLSGSETGKEFSLLESYMPGGGDSGLHVHGNEDECIYLLTGELEVTIGDSPFTLKAGSSCFVPRNTPHRLCNKRVDTARAMHLNTPGTLDSFMRLAGIRIKSPVEVVAAYPSPDQIGAILLLSEEYDFQMLIPPGM
ncbi:MAG TPA: cupin domain-containing protein [Puia sp.]|nr:cupin domain-containing protein [Puia sp.]